MKPRWGVPRLLLAAAILLSGSGCWNSRELKDMAIVTAVGIDTVPGSGKYKVSFQVVNSGQVAPKTVSGGSNPAAPVTVTIGEGDTLFEAIRRTSEKVPRQLFFAHIQLVVISEAFAKQGVSELFDFFERSRETRLLSTVLIAREGSAAQILKTLTPLETIPAVAVVGKINHTSRLWSNSLHTRIDDVIDMLDGEDKVALISGITFSGSKESSTKSENVENSELPSRTGIRGISVLEQGKLSCWLDEPQSRGVLWVRGEVKSTIMTIDAPEKKNAISVEVIRSKTRVTPIFEEGGLRFMISVSAEGAITELKAPIDLTKPEELWKLEKVWADEIKEEILSSVKLAKDKRIDMLQFANRVNRADPKRWRELKKDWKETFAHSKVDVQVEAFIRNQGMRNKSHLSTMGP